MPKMQLMDMQQRKEKRSQTGHTSQGSQRRYPKIQNMPKMYSDALQNTLCAYIHNTI